MALVGLLKLVQRTSSANACRFYCSMSNKRGIVLGVHTGKDQDKYELTSFAKRYDESIGGKLSESLKISGPPKPNQCRVYWGLNKEYEAYAVVGIGDPKTVSKLECINAEKEVIRAAAAVGVNTLVAQNVLDIEVESLGGAECTAVGALLGTFKYQDLKAKDKRSPKPKIQLRSDSDDADGWKRGKILANAQNYTRVLMETPANLMTPTIFAEKVKNHFQKCNIDVKIEAHDADWARELGMNAFLSVASGSDQPPVFLEMTYSKGKSDDPFICLVGKGVTFDSGGISIKPAAGMADMRADMGGAANLVGALAAISQLKLPVNVKALIPLTENLINGHATKPGDVVRAMNGKTICVDNTDAEGRLILADALCYAERSGPPKSNKTLVYWGLSDKHEAVTVVGVSNPRKVSKLECINAENEVIRTAAAVGARRLISENVLNIEMESFDNAECAAVGALLATYKYQELKQKAKQSPTPKICLSEGANNPGDIDGWKRGKILAKAQNFARGLMEAPANLMTPTIFAETTKARLTKCGDVDVVIHDANWARELGMNSFLSVASGSDEPPVFLEITYSKSDPGDPYICLVGKGVTFDCGGISIKPAATMADMRADMGGAANVVGTIAAVSHLNLPVNIKGLIPLTENLINGHATKPGDVVKAMNGKTICVDNTDAEGRLILADALCYAGKFKPKFILDIATLTGAVTVALGNCAAAAYCNDDALWQKLEVAGANTGDRMWRMPLFNHYSRQMTNYESYDLHNAGKKGGGSCTAAAFLREFVPKDTPWIHIDMAGIKGPSDDQIYTLGRSMTGRPMRTLVEFIHKCSKM